MGKSGRLLTSLVAGVRSFKSPSKERPVKDEENYVKKKSKDKCFGSLGKCSSRCREIVAVAKASPEAIEIKCVQVESKDVVPVPVPESYQREHDTESQVLGKSQEGVIPDDGFIQLSPQDFKKDRGVLDREERAASKIQAAFRCFSAQRAFHALRALVRLQAVARGRVVRKRAAASLRCLNALIRIQALARSRRVRNSELGQLVHKHLQQTKQSRKKPAEGWVNSFATAQQWNAKAQVQQDAVSERQRAFVYTFSEQLTRGSQKQRPDSQIDKSHWVWEWLELWTTNILKNGPSTIVVEDHSPLLRSMEKLKINSKGGRHVDNSRKEQRSQWNLSSDDNEESSLEVKKEEEMTDCQDSEKSESLKATVAEGYLAIMPAEQKSTSFPGTLGTPPVPLWRDGDAHVATRIHLQQLQSLAGDSSSMLQLTPSNKTTEADTAMQFTLGSEVFPSSAADCHVLGAEITYLSNVNICMSCQSATSQVPGSTSKGHSIYANNAISGTVLDSPPKESKMILPSVSPFVSQEVCPLSEFMPLSNTSIGQNMQGSIETHGSSTPELSGNTFLNGVLQHEEIMEDRACAPRMSMDSIEAIDGDNKRREFEDTNFRMNGDAARVSGEPELESMGLNTDDSHRGDTLSEANGGCEESMVFVDARSTEVLSKNTNSSGLKHEQTESASPSLPSYMATTKSSKAKIRTVISPKQKLDSTKQKQESPKPNSDPPKTNVDSPTQKVDSASKRRHSLSGLDCQLSPGNPKPAFHVRAGSKTNFSSVRI